MKRLKFNKPLVIVAVLISFALISVVAGCASTPSTLITAPPSASTSTSSNPSASSPATFQMLAISGKALYSSNCAACHGANGEGTNLGPALWGSSATPGTYGVSTLYTNAQDMLDFISKKMPQNNPGGLTTQQNIEVLSYILIQDNEVSPSAIFNQGQLSSIAVK